MYLRVLYVGDAGGRSVRCMVPTPGCDADLANGEVAIAMWK